MIRFRKEKTRDYDAVYELNKAVFGRDAEADLVEELRQQDGTVLSLVASERREILGHILFTPVTVETEGETYRAVALGPMAVHPDCQGYGIGSTLVLEGLKRCRGKGQYLIFVLGHPGYYPRFGFRRASDRGFRSEFGAPDEAFMVIDLGNGSPEKQGGLVRYHPLFRAMTH